jgi:trehalose-6-phosphatase
MAKARLNAIMTRVSRKSGKAKRSECVLGNDIRDEDVVKLLGDHRMEVVPGFDNTKSAFDSYGSANSKDSRDTDHAATLLRVERLLS